MKGGACLLKVVDLLFLCHDQVEGHNLDLVCSTTQVDKGAVVANLAQQLLRIHPPTSIHHSMLGHVWLTDDLSKVYSAPKSTKRT